MTLIFLAPGQGAQMRGMGADLFDAYPQVVEEAEDILGYSLRRLCLEDPGDQLADTAYTQPALYTVGALAYYQRRDSLGRAPDFAAGHSLGEYNALLIAEAFSFADGLRLVQKRGALMGALSGGGMLAVIGPSRGDIAAVFAESGIDSVDAANLNTPTQTVLSGPEADLRRLAGLFEARGARAVPLNVRTAFHSRYMGAMKSAFAAFIADFAFAPLMVPVIANFSALPYRDDEVANNLVQQLDHGVRWTESIQYLLQEEAPVFEELSPRPLLSRMVEEIRAHPSPLNIARRP
ncbi:polyketide biosynthesis malonyl-CoA-[acyl-carrier-protein] transacylase [Methylomagnum ishizawai]|uniref:Malonyl CoA-acyl carrier protein transacylase n=1 Tax=Methylomagnum ishizawai TaxID=1760988 RepID=A0A1Y6DCP5_9GAMM|nr:ACP S-malonyltransferase [Methylomagnum ishizawai]SMF97325.1 polyketide biosynthesis malonyl-CoA-[acyl-carrier-protein] transacylase [Methylomagnum ishizawai]SMF97511.1 polyketide biosynthesis malonyl-CoA-[acyl-carrier-protein] transacylase [Methylomagnum ishizawai]